MLMEELEEQAREFMVPGFLPLEEVVAGLEELVEDEYEEEDDDEGHVAPSAVESAVRRLWDQRLAEQATWPELTDADRVQAAFDDLEMHGVIGRMNFSCCQNCGFGEIADEAEAVTGPAPHGFVFFHTQDSERLVDTPSTLLMSYGSFNGSDQAENKALSLAVGQQLASALQAQGLTVEWDGTLARRIAVTGLDWRRRLPA